MTFEAHTPRKNVFNDRTASWLHTLLSDHEKNKSYSWLTLFFKQIKLPQDIWAQCCSFSVNSNLRIVVENVLDSVFQLVSSCDLLYFFWKIRYDHEISPSHNCFFFRCLFKNKMRDQVKLLFFWISDSCSQFIFYLIHASKVRTTRDNKSAKKITHCNHLKSRKGCAKQNHGSFTSVTPWPGGGTVVLRFPASCTWKILKKTTTKKQ